jgi:hypothetical protein
MSTATPAVSAAAAISAPVTMNRRQLIVTPACRQCSAQISVASDAQGTITGPTLVPISSPTQAHWTRGDAAADPGQRASS